MTSVTFAVNPIVKGSLLYWLHISSHVNSYFVFSHVISWIDKIIFTRKPDLSEFKTDVHDKFFECDIH